MHYSLLYQKGAVKTEKLFIAGLVVIIVGAVAASIYFGFSGKTSSPPLEPEDNLEFLETVFVWNKARSRQAKLPKLRRVKVKSIEEKVGLSAHKSPTAAGGVESGSTIVVSSQNSKGPK